VTFGNALDLDPVNVYALYNLGFISQDRGDDAAAGDYYQQVLDQDPAFTQALFNLGIITESSDLDEAIDLYRRAVDADDTFAAAWMRLGFALQHQGKDDEAEEALGKGVALDPSMANVQAPSYAD
jgi:tetratricopeptide (TPR) repeat protein